MEDLPTGDEDRVTLAKRLVGAFVTNGTPMLHRST